MPRGRANPAKAIFALKTVLMFAIKNPAYLKTARKPMHITLAAMRAYKILHILILPMKYCSVKANFFITPDNKNDT